MARKPTSDPAAQADPATQTETPVADAAAAAAAAEEAAAPAQAEAAAAEPTEEAAPAEETEAEAPTVAQPVPEGRVKGLPIESCTAIAEASVAAGFPVPTQVQEQLDAASAETKTEA